MDAFKGHFTIKWNPKLKHEVENAQRTFDKLTKRGFLVFRLKDGTSEQVKNFSAEDASYIFDDEYVAVPRIVGG